MKVETVDMQSTAGVIGAGEQQTSGEWMHDINKLKHILVPLDMSEAAFKALRYAEPLARAFGAKITLLQIVRPPVYSAEGLYPIPDRTEQLEAMEHDMEKTCRRGLPADLDVKVAARYGYPADDIPVIARELEADLIVTTTHGYTGLKHLLMGSTAEGIVRRAPCPVLVVRDVEREFV